MPRPGSSIPASPSSPREATEDRSASRPIDAAVSDAKKESTTGREKIYSWHFGGESPTIKGQVDEVGSRGFFPEAFDASLILASREQAVSLRRDTGRRQAATWDQRGDFVVWSRRSEHTPPTHRHHNGKRWTTRSHCFIACRFLSGKGRQLGSVLLLVVPLVFIWTEPHFHWGHLHRHSVHYHWPVSPVHHRSNGSRGS